MYYYYFLIIDIIYINYLTYVIYSHIRVRVLVFPKKVEGIDMQVKSIIDSNNFIDIQKFNYISIVLFT